MVAPVTGPFEKYASGNAREGLPAFSSFARWFRQRTPYTLPLDYSAVKSTGILTNWRYQGNSVPPEFTVGNAFPIGVGYFAEEDRHIDHAYSQAYARLKDGLSAGSAGWAETFAQYNKTRKGLVDRCVQLAHFSQALRSRDFGRAARILRTPLPSNVSHRKAASQNFLEYEYGVKPLVSDIQGSLKFLTTDHGWRKLRGRGSSVIEERFSDQGSDGAYVTDARRLVTYTVKVQAGVMVRVDNPDLFLANQLGLIDLALPWKLIPFSFVVDWFVNVEQVLSSLTTWYGVQVDHPYRTIRRSGVYQMTSSSLAEVNNVGVPPSWNGLFGNRSTLDGTYESIRRLPGLPSPVPVFRPFQGFSVNRGAQAIALVLAVLGK